MFVKQVIVVNMEVPMSLGRLAAQVAHASMLAVLNLGEWNENKFSIDANNITKYWLKEHFTKVVVKVWGKEELICLMIKAEQAGIPTGLMIDDGYYTALALGPAEESLLNPLTKKLILL